MSFSRQLLQINEGVYFMKITVCIGSSCHVKGSHQVVRALQQLIRDHHLDDQVQLSGTFCLSNCQKGVSVTVDDALYSVSPDTVEAFFAEHVLAKV